jgi:4-hydroxyphenylpyruvate dioxygenase
MTADHALRRAGRIADADLEERGEMANDEPPRAPAPNNPIRSFPKAAALRYLLLHIKQHFQYESVSCGEMGAGQMGLPIDKQADGQVKPNPLQTDGLVFVEFSAPDMAPIADLLRRVGFKEVARHRSRNIGLWRQGGIDLVLNADGESHAGEFATLHGPCISAIAFRVGNGDEAFDRCIQCSAAPYDGGNGPASFAGRVLTGIGGSLLYLLDAAAERVIRETDFLPLREGGPQSVKGAGFSELDHLTHNVKAGNLETWANFYREIFGFREVFYMDAKAIATGFRTLAVKSPCDKICIAINEPTDPKSQIQEYIDVYKGEGAQHIAFASGDLNASMEALSSARIPTQPIPASYYAEVDQRLANHGLDVARLQRNGILLDGDVDPQTGAWRLLLQVFSKNLMGPIFFEFIERRDNDGFGEGNAKALFEAIERDQIERGVVAGA